MATAKKLNPVCRTCGKPLESAKRKYCCPVCQLMSGIEKVSEEPGVEHWHWTRTKNRFGMGALTYRRENGDMDTRSASKEAYLLANRPPVPGKTWTAKSICGDPECINPQHLKPVIWMRGKRKKEEE